MGVSPWEYVYFVKKIFILILVMENVDLALKMMNLKIVKKQIKYVQIVLLDIILIKKTCVLQLQIVNILKKELACIVLIIII